MDKSIIVFSDIELGGGTLTDDFISDCALSKTILSFAGKSSVDLVLNGDTFDFLKCPTEDGVYPLHVNESAALRKLERISAAHKRVFGALAKFVSRKSNHVYFILGNHDQELAFDKVQKKLKSLLGNGRNVHFPGFVYSKLGIHIEHGHQYDALNRFDSLFTRYNEEVVLNFPFASTGVLSSLIFLKEKHPFLERINSKQELFSMHPFILAKIRAAGFKYIMKKLFYALLRKNNLGGFQPWLIHELLFRWWHTCLDVPNVFHFVKGSKKLYVLGHVHKMQIGKSGKVVVVPDTWRDEYILDTVSKQLFPKKKHFLRIRIKNNDVKDWKLVHVPIKRTVLSFKAVIKDELKYISLAAEEEGYGLRPL